MRVSDATLCACAWGVLAYLLVGVAALSQAPFIITRHHQGDLFTPGGASCTEDACMGGTSGTASSAKNDACSCQCLPHLPSFRDDFRVCVEDIHECSLAPFVSGAMSQKIPYVFLPLKGQIVYPSAEINFTAASAPVCVVSTAQFLTGGGWVDIRNSTFMEPPFRLFRDEGRTFLQWLGEADLRVSMEGRLILVRLMCKDMASNTHIFTPCVAFRVAGSPSVREVLFDAHHEAEVDGVGLTTTEYAAISVCSILLGLIYVASVFLYLHMRKRKKPEKEGPRFMNDCESPLSDGIVKKNPLLQMKRQHHLAVVEENECYRSDSETAGSSDTDEKSEDVISTNSVQVTSALVHAHIPAPPDDDPPVADLEYNAHCESYCYDRDEYSQHQDGGSVERIPEENVSIVETLEGREDRPETVRNIGTYRRKLYFNPAYFDPELLISPPPAALDFLAKIREVIGIAKLKMSSKRFSPSLGAILEEDSGRHLAELCSNASGINLKRENSRHRACSADITLKPCCSSESKHNSIRRWLEDVPSEEFTLQARRSLDLLVSSTTNAKKTKEPVTNQTRASEEPEQKKLSTFKAAEPATPLSHNNSRRHAERKLPSETSTVKKDLPPAVHIARKTQPQKEAPQIDTSVLQEMFPPELNKSQRKMNQVPNSGRKTSMKRRAPPAPTDAVKSARSDVEVQKPPAEGDVKREGGTVVKRKLMDAVIKELVVVGQRGTDVEKFESDSLDRESGFHTPSDYGTPSPPLPLDEEMVMRNDVFNKKTGSKTISKLKMTRPEPEDDHEYEVIVMNPSEAEMRLLSLPELMNSEGYSLVSEVYVNDEFGLDTPSSPPASRIRYVDDGHLTIELEDSPENYVRNPDDSDDFEPDTLDRKPSKRRPILRNEVFVDSLERHSQILFRTDGSFRTNGLRTNDSFRSDASSQEPIHPSPLARLGSLREIFEAKTRRQDDNVSIIFSDTTDCGYNSSSRRLFIDPESRYARRQRKPTPPSTIKSRTPDLIPPRPPKPQVIYEDPPPPRPVHPNPPLPPRMARPPLPPKNGKGRSTNPKKQPSRSNPAQRPLPPLPYSERRWRDLGHPSGASADSLDSSDYEAFYAEPGVDVIQRPASRLQSKLPGKSSQGAKQPSKTWERSNKPEDSGYLSTDSNESKRVAHQRRGSSSTDESLCDGASESGGESIATDSFFFGPASRVTESVDSGVGSELVPMFNPAAILEEADDSDSENVSFVTVMNSRRVKC